MLRKFVLFLNLVLFSSVSTSEQLKVSNRTISGDYDNGGCKHAARYDATSVTSFPMCVGQTDRDLKNGMSIIELIKSRGYLPTCRVLQLMLWMSSMVHENSAINRDTFVDIGANIGSCSVAIAALGFPVVAAEPVQEHVDTIEGSMALNPSFHIELHHVGIAIAEDTIKANFGHGARNWGATNFVQADGNGTFEVELKLKTVDQVIGPKKVSLMKVDCEGCEWAAIKGAKRSLKRIPMIKLELVQKSYTAGNETVSAADILDYFQLHGFDIFTDVWAENNLYFGKKGNEIIETDKMFGSKKFQLLPDRMFLDQAAKNILSAQISPSEFDHSRFLKTATDIIAIEKSLAQRMKQRWLE